MPTVRIDAARSPPGNSLSRGYWAVDFRPSGRRWSKRREQPQSAPRQTSARCTTASARIFPRKAINAADIAITPRPQRVGPIQIDILPQRSGSLNVRPKRNHYRSPRVITVAIVVILSLQGVTPNMASVRPATNEAHVMFSDDV